MNFYNIYGRNIKIAFFLMSKAHFIANRILTVSHGKGGQWVGRQKQMAIAIGHYIIVKA